MQPTELKKLPDWLLEQLPQITETAILSLRDTKLVVTYPDRMEAIHESFSVHDKFHRTLVLSGFFFLKIASTFLNSSFFPKPIKRRIAI